LYHGLAWCRHLGWERYGVQAYLTAMALSLKHLVRGHTGVSLRGPTLMGTCTQGSSAPMDRMDTPRAIYRVPLALRGPKTGMEEPFDRRPAIHSTLLHVNFCL